MDEMGSKSQENPKDGLNIIKRIFAGSVFILLIVSILGGLLFSFVLKAFAHIDKFFLVFLLSAVFNVLLGGILFLAFSASIQRSTKHFVSLLGEISKGNFSIKIDHSSNNKVIRMIVDHMNLVIDQVRHIIQGTYNLTKSIVGSSIDMTDKVKEATASIQEISQTIDEIAAGASEQVLQAKTSVNIMENLSNQISVVYDSYNSIIQETEHVNILNKDGLNSVRILREKSDDYNLSSQKIFAAVENLTSTLNNIASFVESIKNIAEQTNLLALNAAIEAARAGDAGKGFAVVAEEVRKLADQSKVFTEQISSMMDNIQRDSEQAIEAMASMKNVSEQQIMSVNQTEESFNKIANAVDSIIVKINRTNEAIKEIETGKTESVKAIETTAHVSEETAAASEQLAATIELQLNIFEELKKSAEELNTLSKNMDENLSKFKL